MIVVLNYLSSVNVNELVTSRHLILKRLFYLFTLYNKNEIENTQKILDFYKS